MASSRDNGSRFRSGAVLGARSMVVRYRWRVIFGVLLLWGASALVTGFFVAQAYEGARGLEAKRQIKSRILALRNELTDLKDQHAALERKVSMMRGPVLDGDLLDERARAELGRINKNDMVIFVKANAAPKSP
jgi:cell division protein FtsB